MHNIKFATSFLCTWRNWLRLNPWEAYRSTLFANKQAHCLRCGVGSFCSLVVALNYRRRQPHCESRTDIKTKRRDCKRNGSERGHHSFRKGMRSALNRMTNVHKTIVLCYQRATVSCYDSNSIRKGINSMTKWFKTSTFRFHHRKKSERPSSKIAFFQSVRLRNRFNGRLGNNIVGHLAYWCRQISDNSIFFRSMAEGPTLATTLD